MKNAKRITFNMEPGKINRLLDSRWGQTKFAPVVIDFDFDQGKITLNESKSLKVEHDRHFTYKFMKTKVKADGGIEGLYNSILKASKPGELFHTTFYRALSRAAN